MTLLARDIDTVRIAHEPNRCRLPSRGDKRAGWNPQ
jgi:hypothetical protein